MTTCATLWSSRSTQGDVELDIRLQLQTDPHLMPIENKPCSGPSGCRPASRWPRCAFRSRNSIRRRRWSSRDASPTTRGTASPSIARSAIKAGPGAACIYELSKFRHDMNDVPHYEPNGDETFD